MGQIQAIIDVWLPGQFGAKSAEECREKARVVYEGHYAEIRRVCPGERLLEYKLGEGWEPLCGFLGREVPDTEFPRINEGRMLAKQLDILALKTLKRSLVNVGVVMGAVTVLVSGVRWYWEGMRGA